MMGIALLMASCTEDYTDWADPISNGPEEPVSVVLNASPASAVDFAKLTSATVQLFNATVTTDQEVKGTTYKAFITNEDGSKKEEIIVDENG